MHILNKRKYNNIPKVCNLGHKHPSMGECAYCNTIHLLLLAETRTLKSIEYEKSYDLKINGTLICRHKPDFTLYYYDGHIEVHEYKGYPTPDWKLKYKMFEALYPDIKYVVIYQATNSKRVRKNSKRRIGKVYL